ncbi:MAG TPA: gamma-glutamylcyclotransferase [Hyphomicrobiaceae bacterium]|jgi:cation transport protein ChaC|nr:gamma-glutamylcyclotransferase [Hyphomicrobiaceae bacterium]
MTAPASEHWIFAYGSLMWRPGFPYEEARHARLIGYRRCFCIYSMHHRGTPQRPGLVLGLDRGGTSEGIAYRISGANYAAIVRYLREREQVSGVYREVNVAVNLLGGTAREVMALTYVVERAHPSYAGRLTLARQARLIRGASGLSGINLDYLISTLRHLAELGIRERDLERLIAMIGPHTARGRRPDRANASVLAMLRATRRLPVLVPVRGLKLDARRRFLHRQGVLA